MAKTSWWWKRIVFLLATTGKTEFTQLHRVFAKLWLKSRSKKSRKVLGWFCGSFMGVLMLPGNERLLLTTLAGIGVMLLVYRLQLGIWKNYLLDCQRFLKTPSGRLAVSVSCGAIAFFGTYLAISIWNDSPNPWLATGLILEGFVTLLTLVLLVWYLFTHLAKSDEAKFEQLLVQLTDNSPLRRLIAVRQLSQLGNHSNLDRSYSLQLQEYFRLMLTVEQEPIVRETVIKSLESYSEKREITPAQQVVNIPILLKKYRYM